MKKIGIVGGIAPASTLDYYSGIIKAYRAKTNDDSYPEIVIDSVDMTEMLTYVTDSDWDSLVNMLLNSITNLVNAGANFAAIASNTPHIVFDRVKGKSVLPLISIVDATCVRVWQKGCKKVVVIGTRFTMSNGLYSDALSKYDITVVTPSVNDQTTIHNIIQKLEDGTFVLEDKKTILAVVSGILTNQNADGLILGCTELPLIIKDDDLDTLIFNTTQIHIESIVDSM